MTILPQNSASWAIIGDYLVAPPGGETALDQSDAYPKSPHLSDNRGLYGGAPSGKKRTTNQNAPFQISTNQKLTQNLLIFDPSELHTYYWDIWIVVWDGVQSLCARSDISYQRPWPDLCQHLADFVHWRRYKTVFASISRREVCLHIYERELACDLMIIIAFGVATMNSFWNVVDGGAPPASAVSPKKINGTILRSK